MSRRLTRRRFFPAVAAVAAGAGDASPTGTLPAENRRQSALKLRQDVALAESTRPLAPQFANGDETALPRWITAFTKGLPHSQLGEVEPGAYETLLAALSTGKHADFERIARGSGRRLTDPQAAYAFCLEGGDPHRFACPPAPSFSSAEMAAEMAEMYWLALAREIPFRDYATSPLIQQAAQELKTTPRGLFRGPTRGDLDGPYISQFLARPVQTVSTIFEQRYRTPTTANDFMTAFGEWVQIQSGVPPWREYVWDSTPRYIRNGRDLSEWVHYDFLYQAFLNAALILMNYRPEAALNENRAVLSEMNPYKYSKVQDGFVTFGLGQVVDWLGRVTTAALKAAWAQKWLVHRRLRPEVLGGASTRPKRERRSIRSTPTR